MVLSSLPEYGKYYRKNRTQMLSKCQGQELKSGRKIRLFPEEERRTTIEQNHCEW